VASSDAETKTQEPEEDFDGDFEQDIDKPAPKTTADLFRGAKGKVERVALVPVEVPFSEEEATKLQAQLQAQSAEVVEDESGKRILKVSFAGRNTHFNTSIMRRYACLSKEGQAPAICCQKDPDGPKSRFAIIIVRYVTDQEGTVMVYKEEKPPVRWSIIPWVMNDRSFNDLRRLNQGGNPLISTDLRVETENEQYQNFKITPQIDRKGNEILPPIWRRNKQLEREVLDKAAEMRKSLPKMCARRYDEDELKDMLGMASVATEREAMTSSSEDIAAMLGDM